MSDSASDPGSPSADPRPSRLRRLKNWAQRFPKIRSIYYLLAALRVYTIEPPAAVLDELEHQYTSGEDPWGYLTKTNELERYELALEVLDGWRDERLPTAFEVGCGEGLFTSELAERCSSVLAVDMIEVARERAQTACARSAHVEVREWNAVDDDSPGAFDLVVCMDVMDVGWRALAQRKAMRAVTKSVAPDGALLVTAVRKSPVIERALWARWLGRGAHGIVHRFGAVDRRLILRDVRTTSSHLIALYEAAY